MNKRSITGFLLGAVMLFFAFCLLFSAVSVQRFELVFPVMGTVAKVTLHATQAEALRGFDAVRKEFDAVARCADWRKPECELYKLNQAAKAGSSFVCSPMMSEMLHEAKYAYELSDGAFDITVKPLMELWGFYRKRNQPPSETEIKQTLQRVGMDKLRLEPRCVTFLRPGMGIDLGGIAKGYALDRAAAAVEKLGIKQGVIDLGGNLRMLSLPPPGAKSYRIGIREPAVNSSDVVRIAEVKPGYGVSTSGDYERFVMLAGKRYGHIIDPATGAASLKNRSATVIAPSAMRADWLSTALYLRGGKLAEKLQKIFPGVYHIFVRNRKHPVED